MLLAFLAGVFSTLSPCVLPILPIILASALSKHRLGVIALSAGLALSFVAVGLFFATIGFSIGLDFGAFRLGAAVVLMIVGLVLLVPKLQAQFALVAGPVGNWSQEHLGESRLTGLHGQFGVGLLLGAVWIPCVGPTLGAAALLASQGRDLGQVALTMLAFGFGAALPLALIGLMSREAIARWRNRLAVAGKHGKTALGVVLVAIGALIVSGLDKPIEAALVRISPDWLTTLTTRL